MSQFFISIVPLILILILIALAAILIIYQIASYQINNYLNLLAIELNAKINDYYKNNIKCDSGISSEHLSEILIEKLKETKIEDSFPLTLIAKEKPILIYKGIEKKASEKLPYELLETKGDIIYSKYLTSIIVKNFDVKEQEEHIPDVYFASFTKCGNDKIYTFLPLLKNSIQKAIPILGYSLSDEYFGGTAIVTDKEVKVTASIGKNEHNEISAGKINAFPVLILLKTFAPSELSKKYHVVLINIDFKKTIANIFSGKSYAGILGQTILNVLYIVAIAFIIVEIISLIIGIKMTRAITKAVDVLYKGTNRIQAGNLDTTIEIKSEDQLADLAKSFNTMVMSIKELLVEKARKEAMQKELEIARDVQKYLFPSGNVTFPNLEIVNRYVAARMVSGDYYDFFPYEQQLLFVIGDVSGKGISAGLIMANTQAILRSHYLQTLNNGNVPDINFLIKNINNHLFNYSSPNKFVTMCFSLYDASSKTLTYCNAGHCPPILFKADGTIDKLHPTSTVLGAFDNITITSKLIQLETDDIVLFYTDGLIEAFNEQDEEYGEHRVIEHIIKYKNLPLEEIISTLLNDIHSYTNNILSDDIAIIAIKHK
jgi:serine phosphatase RsbU (regulator of sigma subunit)